MSFIIKQSIGRAQLQLPAKCRVCDYTWTAVVSVILTSLITNRTYDVGLENMPDNLECPNCHSLAGDADYEILGTGQ